MYTYLHHSLLPNSAVFIARPRSKLYAERDADMAVPSVCLSVTP